MMKASLIVGICVARDAISASVIDDAQTLIDAGWDVKIFSYANESEIPHVIVSTIGDILFNEHYLKSDLLIYHFGVFYELFNTIFVAPPNAKKIVRYHNITPKQLLPVSEHAGLERSFMQCYNMSAADIILPVSEQNVQDVLQMGFPDDRVSCVPLAVMDGRRKYGFLQKNMDECRFLYVGRFVISKGISDLLEAFEKATPDASLFLAGSTRFSDPAYLTGLRAQAHKNHRIHILEDLSDDALYDLMSQAHFIVLPSYHEGFCKPVIEAMHFGCIPITYDSYNLKFVAKGLSHLIPAGSIELLSTALDSAARALVDRKIETFLPASSNLASYEARVDELLKSYSHSTTSNLLMAYINDLFKKR